VERRLAHVGLTRARKRARIYFASNRRMHGLWSSNIPSRFLDELPEAAVEVTEAKGSLGGYGGYGASRFDDMSAFGSSYNTPGWQRAQARRAGGGRSGGFEEDVSQDYDADTSLPPPERGRSTGAAGRAGVRAAGFTRSASRAGPLTIEGELVAKSTGTLSDFAIGDRVFHIKFGNGNVVAVDGNKLTIAFDKAGEKRVVDSFVERV
jgi:DNA helicase-2/ATP-dependent DNA helicase PcrA